VTERKNAELALRLRSRALDAIGNGVLITRIEAGEEIVEYANPAFETITGYTSAQVVGRDHAGLARAGQQGLLFEQMAQALAAGSAGGCCAAGGPTARRSGGSCTSRRCATI
jgi:PAS domain-containing protein